MNIGTAVSQNFGKPTFLSVMPLWSSGQSSWLEIRRRVRFPALPEKKVVGLEWGSLSLVSTTEELLDRKVAAPV
jgi:hypothetical protein